MIFCRLPACSKHRPSTYWTCRVCCSTATTGGGTYAFGSLNDLINEGEGMLQEQRIHRTGNTDDLLQIDICSSRMPESIG
jgi:hypothetical protein